jgi:hypothetical protein
MKRRNRRHLCQDFVAEDNKKNRLVKFLDKREGGEGGEGGKGEKDGTK